MLAADVVSCLYARASSRESLSQAGLGWSLGTAESISGTIVIGLAVDYTIHLGAQPSAVSVTAFLPTLLSPLTWDPC